MNFVPRWARPAAVIGLRLSVLSLKAQLYPDDHKLILEELEKLAKQIEEMPQ